ncbi:MAG: MFS transporter [Desulfococcaceae bacterium]|jgi:EmrB/QacA subfamily drug resistance transporter|nr:MFS transporter [Desulfococcaceae bacterium]
MGTDLKKQAGKKYPEVSSRKWFVFLLVGIGVFMSTLDGSIVNIALPAIMADVGSSLSTVQWVMMIYLLTVSSLLMSFGRLSDIRGRRWVYSRGLILFSLGSLCCAFSLTAFSLIFSRAFQGLGAAMIMSCTQAIVVETFPPSERGRSLGMMGAVVASGLSAGPALGGWILHISSWQTIFLINVPIGLITALLVNRILKGGISDRTRSEPFDWAGALLMTLTTGSSLFVITHAYEWGYLSIPILCLSGTCIISLIALILQEKKTESPLFHPSLLKIRLFTLPVFSLMILFAGLFTVIFLMPFFLMHPCGFPPGKTGFIMVTPFIFLFLFAPLSGSLSDRIGSRFLCTLGMGIMSLSFFFLAELRPEMSLFSIALPLMLSGIGVAVFIAPNNSTVMGAVPPQFMGVAAGTVATVRNLGMVLGIALAGTIFNSIFFKLSGGLRFQSYTPEMLPVYMAAFRHAMLAGGILSAAGIVITYLRGPDRKLL